MDYTKRCPSAFPEVAHIELGRIQPLRPLLIGDCLLCGLRASDIPDSFLQNPPEISCPERGNGNNFGRIWFLRCRGHLLFSHKRIPTSNGPCPTVNSFRQLSFRAAQTCLTLNAAVVLSCRYSTKIPSAPISFLRGRALDAKHPHK